MKFQNKLYALTDVKWAGKKGFGLFALDNIKAGTFIIEYCGEVLNEKQCKRRLDKYHGKKRHSYILTLDKNTFIDATMKGSNGRFCNHSCNPNAEVQKWKVNNQYRIGIFALKNINKNDEITFDYKFERFGNERQKCLCGANNCRGYLGAKKHSLSNDISDNDDITDTDDDDDEIDENEIQMNYEKLIFNSITLKQPINGEYLMKNLIKAKNIRYKQLKLIAEQVLENKKLVQSYIDNKILK